MSRNGPPPQNAQLLVELVEVLAKALVDHPELVKVSKARSDRTPRVELAVEPDDVGKVIGKDGRTAQAMRVLVNTAAMKLGFGRAFLDILD
ncbi:MAG: KH domain-containing protein [Myxococcales bacterium]|nr:KH domain-containing protein [Myxococcales bacterium]